MSEYNHEKMKFIENPHIQKKSTRKKYIIL